MFLQEIQKTKFAFTFNGQLKTINMLANFNVKKMELTTDGHGLHYALVCTSTPKRVNQLMDCICEWNTHQLSGINLQAMPDCPEIVTFTKKETHMKHFIVKRIFADRDKAAKELESMYRLWTVDSSDERFHSLLPQSHVSREEQDIHEQERVMAENPRDFNQEPASDDDDVESARTSKKHCGGFANSNKGKHPAPTSLLKGNYSAIRSTAQTAIDEPTTAGAEKDAAIAALTASNAKKDAVIERLTNAIEQLATSNAEKDRTIRALESLTAACGSIMDLLKTSTDDAKLQRAQHTNDLETKIDQVRTAVISRAEGTGRQITTALDSHGETMVAEMERMMQEKGACEQHVMDKYQRASAKANRYAQTKKGIFTRKFNKAKKAYVTEIQKLKTDLVVETRLRQCVIDNFFELIPIPSDRQTAKQHRLPHKESPPTLPTPP